MASPLRRSTDDNRSLLVLFLSHKNQASCAVHRQPHSLRNWFFLRSAAYVQVEFPSLSFQCYRTASLSVSRLYLFIALQFPFTHQLAAYSIEISPSATGASSQLKDSAFEDYQISIQSDRSQYPQVRVRILRGPVLRMVYPGGPSKGCYTCRARKVKVRIPSNEWRHD